MKRILSVVAAVLLVLALSVTAFADEAVPSVTYANDGDVSVDDDSPEITLDDETLHVEVGEAAKLDDDQETKLDAAVAEIADAAVVEAVDVELVNDKGVKVDEEYFNGGNTLTVVFVHDKTAKTEVIKVLYWDAENNEWDVADSTDNGDGTVTATFAHLCTVVFVKQDIETSDTSGTSGTSGTGSGDRTSPQTGYDTAVWTAAATALVLAAVCCFVSARKKVTA